MVKLVDLKAPKEKIVRNLVHTPTGVIRVFEPTLDDYNTILEVQREKGKQDGDVIEFDGATVVRDIFPVLTDLDMGDLTDQEMEDILAEPTIYLLMVQNYVSQIITEINTLFVQRIKTELTQASAILDQTELVTLIPKMMKTTSKVTGNDKVLSGMDKIQRAKQELEDKAKKKAEKTVEETVEETAKETEVVG